MSLTWKDTTVTISMVAIAIFTIATMAGMMDKINFGWALSTFVVILVMAFTGAITGTALMMKHAWSSIVMYILAAVAVVITLVNAFLNSEAWFVALSVTAFLIWVEFVGLDLFAPSESRTTHISSGGAA